MNLYSFPGVLLVTLVFLSSCFLRINSNEYNYLSRSQRAQVKQFDTTRLGYITKEGDNYLPVEITSADIARQINKGGYVWVFNWIPFCKSESCHMLSYYERLFDKISADPQNSFFLVNYFYDSATTAPHVQRSAYRRYVFVPKDAVYGHRAFPGHDKFTAGYTNDSIGHNRPAHLLFHNGKLIYVGGDMKPEQFAALTNSSL